MDQRLLLKREVSINTKEAAVVASKMEDPIWSFHTSWVLLNKSYTTPFRECPWFSRKFNIRKERGSIVYILLGNHHMISQDHKPGLSGLTLEEPCVWIMTNGNKGRFHRNL